tara:strand:+ start:1668 stop:3731 length:2064 start_codon:yes stop_codon:yes gene_type:complete
MEERIFQGQSKETLFQEVMERIEIEGDPIGSLQRSVQTWKALGCAPEIIDWIEHGVKFVFWETPPQSEDHNRNYVKPGPEMDFTNKEVTRLLLIGAIEEVPEAEAAAVPGYEVPIGCAARVTTDGKIKYRKIVNATDGTEGPNNFMIDRKFKMESIDNLLKMMGKNWFGFTFDLRAGFHHLMLHPDHRRWLRFKWAGRIFQYRVLPFGPKHSPYLFSKCVSEFVKILRRGCVRENCDHRTCRFRAAPHGVYIVPYVDDFAVVAASKELCIRIREEIIVPLLAEMGWIRALDKGSWEPSQRFEFLGLLIDSTLGQVIIPDLKLKTYLSAIDKILSEREVTPKMLAALAGKIVSIMRAFAPALVYLRTTFAWIASLVDGAAGWSSLAPLSDAARADLKWLRRHLKSRNGRFAWRPSRVIVLAGDASTSVGWGSTCRDGNSVKEAQGFWTHDQKLEDIHILELMSILFGIRSFKKILYGRSVQIVTDNMISFHTVPKGSSIPAIQNLIRSIYDELGLLDATLTDIIWIPTHLNTIPDQLSRWVDVNDWCVRQPTWDLIAHHWTDLQVDRFASSLNARLPRFNSRWAHPRSENSNALAQDWTKTFSYACPPMAMLQTVVYLIDRQGAHAVLIVPHWEHQPWWPTLRSMARSWVYLGTGAEAFQQGPSNQCAPWKNPKWTFYAVEVRGSGRL